MPLLFSKFLGLLMLISIAHNSLAFDYTITEEQLQQRLTQRNWAYQNPLISAQLLHPQIMLLADNNRIALNAKIEASVLQQIKADGFISLEGDLFYDAEKGAFYLKNFVIKTLQIDNMDEQSLLLVQEALQKALRKLLQAQPIYQLNDNKLQEKLAKSSLESVRSQDKQLIFSFSLL